MGGRLDEVWGGGAAELGGSWLSYVTPDTWASSLLCGMTASDWGGQGESSVGKVGS